ncbi:MULTISPECIES: preprotein translocase subunit SecA [unclassified Pseudodesulfovibrio]|uniref:preprotein translocase subunit SecA n=1 Tax=unclassified Pseudodesulfovibrio TaxID=2661612 RepID=UPI000FEBB15A|nr:MULTISPECIES: preprotein translocase subunit SecA [unclassified Pseudodesulfovibrio]MCJ2165334.1 preprotein translocase subunit SecA [Pseudodesulfovibrio sp. S3-i]RWU02799.1 preprotein translocase subunit SecA [Pseudodesulfovibrio sp. S3]
MLKMIFGSKNDRYLKKLKPVIEQINALEPEMQALSDADFPAKVAMWKGQVSAGEMTLDDLLPQCFALVREAGKRAFDPPMRHFDVQLIGGYVLHQGKIAEMKTGEGKTLVATLAVVLNALSGKGVHVVTVNDYLAARDAEWMGQLYGFLGLTVGVIVHGLTDQQRQEAYAADITYGTNNEFGFDYLRDNMKFYKEQLVQRPLNFAIVDEVDSILIDEARTPLIISGPGEKSSGLYRRIDAIVPKLVKSNPTDPEDKDAIPDGDFVLDEKTKAITLTDAGVEKIEGLLGVDNLFDPQHISLQHHVLQALKAHHCFLKDVEYIVKDDQVVLVDEFTGRLMPGRRLSDGLHQAIEAKENVKVEAENQTLASITFQNYFRMYEKLAGMTGTADTEAVEFGQIYGLDVVVIPTNQNMIRIDNPDAIYKSQEQKYAAIAEDIEDCYRRGQPTLVGTVSIEKSELLSDLLKKRKVPHNVLNAKQHEREAEIVLEAGQKKKVTIATNMAGRGTDIKLGEGVRELGGLHIIGTERHESRRIDNQLRGRAGRQGDPGSSRFYLALDDDLMRLFGSDRLKGIMEKLGLEDGMAIENRMVSGAIEKSQTRVEGHHYEIRKQLLEYDDVMNQQRGAIYGLRHDLMKTSEVEGIALEYAMDLLEEILEPALDMKDPDQDTIDSVRARLEEVFNFERFETWHAAKLPSMEQAREWVDEIFSYLRASTNDHYQEVLRYFMLDSLDRNWKEHLLNMDHLRDGIGLRGYGQKDPKQEYKREGFALFSELVYTIKENALRAFSHLRIEAEVKDEEFKHEGSDNLEYTDHESAQSKKVETVKKAPKISRNADCPCGSGKKYKKCCGS